MTINVKAGTSVLATRILINAILVAVSALVPVLAVRQVVPASHIVRAALLTEYINVYSFK